jgi:hypothetical protein
VVISSIGMDREDNGGTFANQPGMTKGKNIGFTLWNVAWRRLPPLWLPKPRPSEPALGNRGDPGGATPGESKEPRP